MASSCDSTWRGSEKKKSKTVLSKQVQTNCFQIHISLLSVSPFVLPELYSTTFYCLICRKRGMLENGLLLRYV